MEAAGWLISNTLWYMPCTYYMLGEFNTSGLHIENFSFHYVNPTPSSGGKLCMHVDGICIED